MAAAAGDQRGSPDEVTQTSTSLGELKNALPSLEAGSKALLVSLQAIEGNGACVDCAALNPDWASVTLGCCASSAPANTARWEFDTPL